MSLHGFQRPASSNVVAHENIYIISRDFRHHFDPPGSCRQRSSERIPKFVRVVQFNPLISPAIEVRLQFRLQLINPLVPLRAGTIRLHWLGLLCASPRSSAEQPQKRQPMPIVNVMPPALDRQRINELEAKLQGAAR